MTFVHRINTDSPPKKLVILPHKLEYEQIVVFQKAEHLYIYLIPIINNISITNNPHNIKPNKTQNNIIFTIMIKQPKTHHRQTQNFLKKSERLFSLSASKKNQWSYR